MSATASHDTPHSPLTELRGGFGEHVEYRTAQVHRYSNPSQADPNEQPLDKLEAVNAIKRRPVACIGIGVDYQDLESLSDTAAADPVLSSRHIISWTVIMASGAGEGP